MPETRYVVYAVGLENIVHRAGCGNVAVPDGERWLGPYATRGAAIDAALFTGVRLVYECLKCFSGESRINRRASSEGPSVA